MTANHTAAEAGKTLRRALSAVGRVSWIDATAALDSLVTALTQAEHVPSVTCVARDSNGVAFDTVRLLGDREAVQAVLDLKDQADAAERRAQEAERSGCAFGCGPYPDGSVHVGSGIGILPACPVHGWVIPLLDAAAARADTLTRALTDLLDDMGVDDIDPRLRYVTAQITREVLADARAALSAEDGDA